MLRPEKMRGSWAGSDGKVQWDDNVGAPLAAPFQSEG